ncbi:hypothetical protein GCG21_03990 [Pseudactinotalea sp. HY160]|uniref:DUF6186 family protein n=1 Tax=Pseudactinotalea sp. HY160 TaxID=2654490 RepID=UPI00128DFA8E|nr:DUF6186 family protein [Pseudactinotalea sp. HY160]MPV49178.1 hypothetical protein [Pseudactinotalea sp. HY160]
MRLITIAVYSLCLAAALALTAWSHRHPDRVTPVAGLLDSILSARAARITLLVFWWWLGWHFLVS